jgi:membrane-bound lytic murein transglycosylase C
MKYFYIYTSLITLIFTLTSCTTKDFNDISNVLQSKDHSHALSLLAKEKSTYYVQHPEKLKSDFKYLQNFVKKISSNWGENNVEVPKKKEYVQYMQDYKSRAIIDFTKGTVRVETLGDKKSLQKSIVTTLLLPEDPRKIDLYGSKDIKLGGRPYLYGEVKDDTGKDIRYQWRANRYAEILIKKNFKTKKVKKENKNITVSFVEFDMVKSHTNIRANKFKPYVKEYAKKYNLEESLVYAIIKTESDFNQFAVSGAGAYGLMQIVPSSAGIDAYYYLNAKKVKPSKEYLFDPKNNIELGVTYLHILDKNYLKGINNRLSREYCVISAYNTGSGNVLKTFSSDKNRAKQKINSLSPTKVYNTLRTELPYDETRNYLKKVVYSKKEFIRL